MRTSTQPRWEPGVPTYRQSDRAYWYRRAEEDGRGEERREGRGGEERRGEERDGEGRRGEQRRAEESRGEERRAKQRRGEQRRAEERRGGGRRGDSRLSPSVECVFPIPSCLGRVLGSRLGPEEGCRTRRSSRSCHRRTLPVHPTCRCSNKGTSRPPRRQARRIDTTERNGTVAGGAC